jgi:hypothetical protein
MSAIAARVITIRPSWNKAGISCHRVSRCFDAIVTFVRQGDGAPDRLKRCKHCLVWGNQLRNEVLDCSVHRHIPSELSGSYAECSADMSAKALWRGKAKMIRNGSDGYSPLLKKGRRIR